MLIAPLNRVPLGSGLYDYGKLEDSDPRDIADGAMKDGRVYKQGGEFKRETPRHMNNPRRKPWWSQAGHFVEELSAGLHERLPALFGLPSMSLQFFVSFNVAWLIIWGISAWGLAARIRVSLFPLWFLGIGCAINGLAHPALSILAGGYFPGLLTSPFVGVLGIMLLRRLRDVTHAVASPLAGFSIIEAEDVDEVVRLVSNTPCARAEGVIEIRPLWDTSGNDA